ncbi:hypothetical protein BC835DRAFT_1320873 [Cytidiella melzeri]|nr:hypothetical protein BC835DRAFT_1320873 [Cytidiella melzeri]
MPGYRVFQCDSPDFSVRSVPDGDVFSVKRECLTSGSEVFRDMFSCCDAGFYMVNTLDEDNKTLELHESAVVLNTLFQLLHSPPAPFVASPAEESQDFTRVWEHKISEATIPWPLLPSMFVLADKYALSREVTGVLRSHLAAYASVFPLQVYGTACTLGFSDIAAEASAHLLHPPLSKYGPEEIKVIPTAEAYHQLVLLHDFRVKRLSDILGNEEVFPHGYGECSRHSQRTKIAWEGRKQAISSQIKAATDVAALMEPLVDEMADCQTCRRACKAAVAMLAYKCARIPRRIDRVEPDY